MRGLHIVIDGPPGSGKTTQVALLRDRLHVEGLPVLILTDLNQQKPSYDFRTNPRLKMLSVAVAYSELIQKVHEMKGQGAICLVERSHLGVMADLYYGRGEMVDYETLNRVAGFAVGEIEPDVVIVLDAPVDLLGQRILANDGQSAGLDEAYLSRVRKGYLWEAQQRQYPIVSVAGTPDKTFETIWGIVEPVVSGMGKQGKPKREDAVSIGQILKAKQLTPIKSAATAAPTDNTALDLGVSRLLSNQIRSVSEVKFNQSGGKVKFYTPPKLDKLSSRRYIKSTKRILRLRDDLEEKLAKRAKTTTEVEAALVPLLPLSTEVRMTLQLSDSKTAKSLAQRLMLDSLSEANLVGKKILDKLGSTNDRQPRAHRKQSQDTTEYDLSNINSLEHEPVQLVDYWPKNEFDLLPDLLYQSAGLTLQELKAGINSWTYAQKAKTLQSTLAGTRLQVVKAQFVWDILCDQITAHWLERLLPGSLLAQPLTPRFGYDTPQLVESSGCSDLYDECFDESLSLYSFLQSAGFEGEAQYATLLGHNNHHRLTHDFSQLADLLSQKNKITHPGVKQLLDSMSSRLKNIYPVAVPILLKL